MFNFNKDREETMDDERSAIPLLPLRDVVVFPYMIVPLFVGREKSISALESAMKYEKEIFLVAQRNAENDNPSEEDIYIMGTVGSIIQLLRLPDGTVKALVEGQSRGVIREYIPNEDFFLVKVDKVEEEIDDTLKIKTSALMRNIAEACLLYTSPSPRDRTRSRMPSSA